MKTFSLLIKPASADCNLRCKYCFYIDHLEKIKGTPRMSDKVLEKMIASYMQTNQNNNYANNLVMYDKQHNRSGASCAQPGDV